MTTREEAMERVTEIDAMFDSEVQRWVPHKIVCKCGAVISSGLQLHTGGYIFPSSVTEFALCDKCQANLGD